MALNLLFSAVFLCAVAAVFAAGGVGVAATPEEYCRPGHAIPHNPLPCCREYVKRRCVGEYVPDLLPPCCGELSPIPTWCRCEAVRIMANGVTTELGVKEGRIEAFPRCPREAMKPIAARLAIDCNLTGSTHGDFCGGVMSEDGIAA